jgi:hypothetical protein
VIERSRYSSEDVVLGILIGVTAVGMVVSRFDVRTNWALAGLVGAVVAWYGFRGRPRPREEEHDLAEARELYVSGEISLPEFERRAELAVDGEAGSIRQLVEEINGVGPDTSAEVALAFDDVEELREADASELMEIPGVGPWTASEIMDRAGRSP